jgi:tetratricopeptide (TPR) repeat protein
MKPSRKNRKPALAPAKSVPPAPKPRLWPWALALCLLVAIAYAQLGGNQFINWDDPDYVVGNRMVAGGLTARSVAWAFTTGFASNWHPLTWLSHMLDANLFGATPAASHWVNLLWYLGSAVLVFYLLIALSAPASAAFLMAAFWSLHPLHVESVAWAAERKDLLAAFFFLAATLAYLRYAKAPRLGRYLAVTGLFVLALLSKPMAVTWPCVTLLLDFWPLKRLGKPYRAVYEKLPWFCLALISAIVTLVVQSHGRAVKTLVAYPLGSRALNAGVAYVVYLSQSVWPSGLTVYYPHPHTINVPPGLAAWALAGLVTALAIALRRKRPYLLWGWLYFLGTLVPVIGLVQVGSQAHADRYTLLPQLGLVVSIGLLIEQVVTSKLWRRAVGAGFVVVLAALMALTWRQVGYWQDSATLFSQNLRVAGANDLAEFNLGTAYSDKKQLDLAVAHFLEAARLGPNDATTYNNLGNVYLEQKEYQKAADSYLRAIQLDNKSALTYVNLGNAHLMLKRETEAEAAYRQAIKVAPALPQAWFHLADLQASQGKFAQASQGFEEAALLAPEWAKARELRDKARALAAGQK